MSEPAKNAPATSGEEAAGREEGSRVRSRAWRHLRRLLSAGAFTGATLNIEACPPVVCDPLPPPLECSNNPSTADMLLRLFSEVRWLEDGADLILSATMQLEAFDDTTSLVFADDPVLTGATLIDATQADRTLEFTCLPDSGVEEVLVSIPVDCEGIDEVLELRFDLSAPPEAGRRIAVESAE